MRFGSLSCCRRQFRRNLSLLLRTSNKRKKIIFKYINIIWTIKIASKCMATQHTIHTYSTPNMNFLTIFRYKFTVKNRCFTELPKKVPEISKSIRRGPQSQKTDKKIYETFKGSSRVPRGRTLSYETFFQVPYRKKRFIQNL
jgi:hypothetical protein